MNNDEMHEWSREHVWFPFSRPGEVAGERDAVILERGSRSFIEDIDGNNLLDAVGAMEAMAVGHGQQRLIDAATRQMSKLSFIDTFRYASTPAIELAHTLAQLAPGVLNRVHFTPGGSEAVEVAIKLAIQYHYLRGHRDRRRVVVRHGAFHGVTFGAMNCDGGYYATRNDIYLGNSGFGVAAAPTSAENSWGPAARFASSAAEIRQAVIDAGPETVAAVVVDGAATASGVALPPAEDLRAIRTLCDEFDILLIVDEVITGFCRAGDWFISSLHGVVPDLMPVSKALSSGYLPIGATLVSKKVEQAFLDGDPSDSIFTHGQTFGAHPVACAVALENLKIMEEEDYVSRGRAVGEQLRESLRTLSRHESFVDVRGLSMVNGLELRRPEGSSFATDREAVLALRRRLRGDGLITIAIHPGTVFLITPPFTLQASEIELMTQIIDNALTAVETM